MGGNLSQEPSHLQFPARFAPSPSNWLQPEIHRDPFAKEEELGEGEGGRGRGEMPQHVEQPEAVREFMTMLHRHVTTR